MTSMHRPRRLAVGLVGALALAGCSTDGPSVAADRRATPYAASFSLSDVDRDSTIGVARTIPELLPNHQFEILGGRFAPNSQVVVVATPTAVEPEAATDWGRSGADEAQARRVDFDDRTAESRTWIVTLRLERVLAGSAPTELLPAAADGGELTVRLTSSGGTVDQGRYESGILGLGRSVWFLTAWDDQPQDAFGIAWFGGAVASVAKDGSLEFGLLSPERREEIDESAYSVDRLAELAAGPIVRIPRDGE